VKSASIVLANELSKPRYLSQIAVSFRNAYDFNKTRWHSSGIVFGASSNLDLRTTDTAGAAVAGAEVSLIERGLVFIGDWQPAVGLPAGAVVGNCYKVTAGGDYGGETWEAGDLAVVITGLVLERRVKRFAVTDAGGYARLMASYNVDLLLSVTNASWQAEHHVLRYEAGANAHNVTMYPLVSVVHTPRGHCVSIAPGERGNTIYL
jgi:hypothetical protein